MLHKNVRRRRLVNTSQAWQETAVDEPSIGIDHRVPGAGSNSWAMLGGSANGDT
jgi:hypothetical protein